MAIDTIRLQLVPFAPAHLLALIEGTERFEERFGLRAADGLRAFIVSDEVSPAWLAQLRASSTPDPWIHAYAVVDRESRSVVGSARGPFRPTAEPCRAVTAAHPLLYVRNRPEVASRVNL